MTKATHEDWLYAGFRILVNKGHNQLTIDNLLLLLGVTKGSFYHHFKSRQDFTEQLLGYWREHIATRAIRELQLRHLAPLACLDEVLVSVASSRDVGTVIPQLQGIDALVLEMAIRAWAQHCSYAANHQQSVDQERMAFLNHMFCQLVNDQTLAKSFSWLLMLTCVGEKHVPIQISKQQFRQVLLLIRQLVVEQSIDNVG
ncbi:TetR/AcrR family transcriptional regulator [Zooshikella ganghwensis]|uniref:TetR/AcrR family transcriptional regulator n=1 Tax=Zooshikella ganghwensis TaxID=202772 RepID=A0A4P9VJI8_9GAMM|nr:TetR/AcrR family transcriptional regulator [Zooshikella ganghwensis]RDH43435.1 TetR/AcrR family transcriptional regulator [Zooshikella ganghwensis]